jgi:flavorubredoxin
VDLVHSTTRKASNVQTPFKTYQAPTQIAPETFVIHDHVGEGLAPVIVPINTMVIRAKEPVVVDTGFADNEKQFLSDVFSIVEPEDIRWVFISHDDIDHTGNVNALMQAAPNATLVINWFLMERMGSTLEVPPFRMRWVGDNESFSVGDRELLAVRPPVYDSPTTRGLFDPSTGVYWGSDSFAAPMTEVVSNADQQDTEFWTFGMHMFHQYLSPWFAMLDEAKFQRSVDRIASLDVRTIASCHGATIGRHRVAEALTNMRTFPQAEVPPMPGQEVLDQIIQSMTVGAPA